MFSCSRLCQFYFSLPPVFNHGVVAFSICVVLLCFFFLSSCWIYGYSFCTFSSCLCVCACTSFLTMLHLFLLFRWANCGFESNNINNCSPNLKLNHYTFSGWLWIKESSFKLSYSVKKDNRFSLKSSYNPTQAVATLGMYHIREYKVRLFLLRKDYILLWWIML